MHRCAHEPQLLFNCSKLGGAVNCAPVFRSSSFLVCGWIAASHRHLRGANRINACFRQRLIPSFHLHLRIHTYTPTPTQSFWHRRQNENSKSLYFFYLVTLSPPSHLWRNFFFSPSPVMPTWKRRKLLEFIAKKKVVVQPMISKCERI